MKFHKILITKKELDEVFVGTNFGDRTPRQIVDKSLQEIADGYSTGYTARQCLGELGLIRTSPKDSKKVVVTELGYKYLQFKKQYEENMKKSVLKFDNQFMFQNKNMEIVKIPAGSEVVAGFYGDKIKTLEYNGVTHKVRVVLSRTTFTEIR